VERRFSWTLSWERSWERSWAGDIVVGVNAPSILEDLITRKIKNSGSNEAFNLTFWLAYFGLDYIEAGF
jgi:hypothetical protein